LKRTALLLAAAVLSACGGGSTDGSGAQKFAALALFDPVPVNPADAATVPFPFDGFFAGSNDPTLNIPNASNAPFVTAANLQDGFSTSASWFLDLVGFIDFTNTANISDNLLIYNGSNGQRLVFGVDYTVQPSAATTLTGGRQVPISRQRSRVLIEFLKPLAPSTTYVVGLKGTLRNSDGLTSLASKSFELTRSAVPISQQTDPILASYSPSQKATLEALRSQIIRPAVEGLGRLAGVAESDLILAWSVSTQSSTKTLARMAESTATGAIAAQSTGRNLSQINPALPNVADVFVGTFTSPYYLAKPSSAAPTAPLSTFWAADTTRPDTAARFLGRVPCGAYATGATLPDGQTAAASVSTTVCYPFPQSRSSERLPMIVTVPNAGSGQTKPAAGWPVVIFQHGITGNRTQMLALAPALAQAGFVVVSLDLPLHGLTDRSNPFYNNQLFSGTPAAGLTTTERTFDVDYVNNASSAPGADGAIDPAGTHFINLSSLITSRDNLRQAVADLLVLRNSVGSLDLNNDGVADIDGTQVRFAGLSLGGIVGGTLMGVDVGSSQKIGAASLSVAGGGIAKLLDASKTFGPRIAAGLAASGVVEGTDTYETFLRFAQTLVDSADPINFAASASSAHPLLLSQVIGDTVVPNNAEAGAATASRDLVTVKGFISGTESLIRLLNLTTVTASTTAASGLRVAVNFAEGSHGSLLDPTASAATTQEMQRQTANFLRSNGQCLPFGGNCPSPN
jgi:hypothetical protein